MPAEVNPPSPEEEESMASIDVRPEVAAFALLMEARLRANDHKPGWKHDLPGNLYRRIEDEMKELWRAICIDGRLIFAANRAALKGVPDA
jgi:hypothetical protein